LRRGGRNGFSGASSATICLGVGWIGLPSLKFAILLQSSADAFSDDGRWGRWMRSLEKPSIEFDMGGGFLGQMYGHRNVFALRWYFNEWHDFLLTPYLGFGGALKMIELQLDRSLLDG
jgi:hypothetical protein